ncbi:hypothetical protein IGI04_032068 [Brassica rapa subsp. trilocularis]|uniref:Uncharacterized protein n=1 Tax=Brassica rapa subsp. trilocularis TaxID=1813537 RepID=A0ABQ7LVE1_BRACM|nr:hypothetical protein IGI04_032068 [Brassica rapa subsp. trilocularis]
MRMHWLRLPSLQYQTRMVKGIASKWPGFSILYSTSKNIGPALAPIQAIPKITAGARQILEDGNETSSVSNPSQFERCTRSAGEDTLLISISEEDIVQCPDS